MPKLPKGMWKKGNAYYYRKYRNGKRTWYALGSDYDTACRSFGN